MPVSTEPTADQLVEIFIDAYHAAIAGPTPPTADAARLWRLNAEAAATVAVIRAVGAVA